MRDINTPIVDRLQVNFIKKKGALTAPFFSFRTDLRKRGFYSSRITRCLRGRKQNQHRSRGRKAGPVEDVSCAMSVQEISLDKDISKVIACFASSSHDIAHQTGPDTTGNERTACGQSHTRPNGRTGCQCERRIHAGRVAGEHGEGHCSRGWRGAARNRMDQGSCSRWRYPYRMHQRAPRMESVRSYSQTQWGDVAADIACAANHT